MASARYLYQLNKQTIIRVLFTTNNCDRGHIDQSTERVCLWEECPWTKNNLMFFNFLEAWIYWGKYYYVPIGLFIFVNNSLKTTNSYETFLRNFLLILKHTLQNYYNAQGCVYKFQIFYHTITCCPSPEG